MTDVIIVMEIRVQNHKCNEVENAFPIFKESCLVRVHTDSNHNGRHNKLIFAVFYVWQIDPYNEVLNWCCSRRAKFATSELTTTALGLSSIRNFVRVRQECGIFWCCHGNEWSREDRSDEATPMIAILAEYKYRNRSVDRRDSVSLSICEFVDQ